MFPRSALDVNYKNLHSKPIKVFDKFEDGRMFLLNREKRDSWVNNFVEEPLRKLGCYIGIDLNCEETEKGYKS